jgi:hypothetical protein
VIEGVRRGHSACGWVWVWILCAGVLGMAGGGCAGYKLGPTGELPAGNRSVQINPVVNATMEPRLGAAVNQALRQEIQRDGTFRLNTRGDGDLLVNVEIYRYHRRGIAFDPRDTLTATDYELTMEARVVATERRSGREVLKKEARGRTTIRIGTDLVSAERQALPVLAEDLARHISVLLVDGDW